MPFADKALALQRLTPFFPDKDNWSASLPYFYNESGNTIKIRIGGTLIAKLLTTLLKRRRIGIGTQPTGTEAKIV
jgi:hypothetical protein